MKHVESRKTSLEEKKEISKSKSMEEEKKEARCRLGDGNSVLGPHRAFRRGSHTVHHHHSFPQPCDLRATQEGWRATQLNGCSKAPRESVGIKY